MCTNKQHFNLKLSVPTEQQNDTTKTKPPVAFWESRDSIIALHWLRQTAMDMLFFAWNTCKEMFFFAQNVDFQNSKSVGCLFF